MNHAWLIMRIYDDRQRQNLAQVVKKPAKLGPPEAADIIELAELCKIEVHFGAIPLAARKKWPWSAVAYTSRSRDGIGRSGGLVRMAARPKSSNP